jgi:hypothetical protein
MHRMFWDVLVIISLMALVIKAALDGLISPEWAAIALVVLVIGVALGGSGVETGGPVRSVLRIALPVTSLAMLIVAYGPWPRQTSIRLASGLGAILVMLFGIYLIFWGAFSETRRSRDK